MELIAAIDLLEGRSVRLQQGDYERPIRGADDPAALARDWVEAGVRRLHLVDLEGARAGQPRQLEQLVAVAAAARATRAEVRIQVGGGLRTPEAVDALLSTGVADFVILGTAALTVQGFARDCALRWPGRILVALDLRDGRPALDGWLREAAGDPLEIGRQLCSEGAAGLLVTDTRRDGTLAGPNLDLLRAFREAIPDAWLGGAGGIGSVDDLVALREVGLDGAVVGLALLDGSIGLAKAVEVSG